MTLTNQWSWRMEEKANKSFKKLEKIMQQRILDFFQDRVLESDPRTFGKAMTGNLKGYWSYRIGQYRVIADIQDNVLMVIAVAIDHRRTVYDFNPS